MKKLLFIFIASTAMLSIDIAAQNTYPFPSSGWVGLGTNNPQQQLDVVGNIKVSNALYSNLGSHDWGNVHWGLLSNNNMRFGVGLHINETGSNNVGGDFSIWRYADNGDYLAKCLTIKRNSGFWGIKTDNPQADLQLGDRFTFQDGGWKVIGYNVAWSNSLSTNARLVTAPSSFMAFVDNGNIAFFNAPSNTAATNLNDGHYGLILHNSGQVGIGTSYSVTSFSDQATKFFVEGGVKARKVKVDQSTWSDYVFYPTYKLLPLNEVESYIKQYQHLPDIPSAAEVEKNGIDLGDTQAALLKKIEELTLYVIDQNKKIEILQQEVKTLKQTIK